MSRTIKKGATSQSIDVLVLDSTSATGGRKTGLAYNTASLTAYYKRNGASPVAITLATLAAINSAWSSGGFKEADATNMPGLYRLDVPNAALASGADSVVITLRGATGMVQADVEISLVDNVAADLATLLGTLQTSVDDVPTNAELSAAIAAGDDAMLAQIALVKAKTDNLPSDPADQSLIIAATDALATSIDALPTNAELATALGTADDAVLVVVNAIKSKTDNLPSDPADASVIAGLIGGIETKIDTLGGVADGIAAKTVNLPSDPADQSLIVAATDALATAIDALPTNAELATALGGADDALLTQVAAVKSVVDALATALADVPTNSELGTALAGADDAVLAAVAGVLAAVEAIDGGGGGGGLTAAQTRAALGMAAANLDAQLEALAVALAALPTASADALLDRVDGVETNRTVRQALRLQLAVMCGKLTETSVSGGKTVVVRDTNDSVDRVTASVDRTGNRLAVTLDAG
jgi:hypothetical protein